MVSVIITMIVCVAILMWMLVYASNENEREAEKSVILAHRLRAQEGTKVDASDIPWQIVADHYGIENQTQQTIEELAELSVALCKIHRYGLNGETYGPMAEEIADVEIMLGQLKYLYRIDGLEIDKIKTRKFDRQMIRVKNDRGE